MLGLSAVGYRLSRSFFCRESFCMYALIVKIGVNIPRPIPPTQAMPYNPIVIQYSIGESLLKTILVKPKITAIEYIFPSVSPTHTVEMLLIPTANENRLTHIEKTRTRVDG
jgi:hypothetical protein